MRGLLVVITLLVGAPGRWRLRDDLWRAREHGKGNAEGCYPEMGEYCEPTLDGMRARFAQATAGHTVAVQIVCDPIVCQPGLFDEAMSTKK